VYKGLSVSVGEEQNVTLMNVEGLWWSMLVLMTDLPRTRLEKAGYCPLQQKEGGDDAEEFLLITR